MAVYTDIDDAALTSLLTEYDLGPPLAFKGIAEGVENSNFMLETPKGRFILTVFEKRARPEDLPFFLGRKGSVKDDFAALAAALPAQRDRFPARWYLAVSAIVLEKGNVEGDARDVNGNAEAKGIAR